MTTIPDLSGVNAAVAKAIEEIQRIFQPSGWDVQPDGAGGARIRFESVELPDTYQQSETWIGAHIPAQIPYADVYPIFIRGDLIRRDGTALTPPVTPNHSFMGVPAVQVSRRTNGVKDFGQSAAMKLQKVIAWMHKS